MLELIFDGKVIKQENIDNINGYGFIWVADEEAESGEYTLRVSNLFFENDTIKDYTVNVYAIQKV